MKLYIAVLEAVPDFITPTLVAHASGFTTESTFVTTPCNDDTLHNAPIAVHLREGDDSVHHCTKAIFGIQFNDSEPEYPKHFPDLKIWVFEYRRLVSTGGLSIRSRLVAEGQRLTVSNFLAGLVRKR